MINDIYFPGHLSSEELDEYLIKGWYRMGKFLFSTNHIEYDEQLYRVFWLRYNIGSIIFGKVQRRIMSLNQQFSIEIKTLTITEELEELYSLYKSNISFQPPPTVRSYLDYDDESAIFNTDIIEIRDNNTLVAAGIFDKGNKSVAAIMNFYNPEYKKFSLGKYMMLLTINIAKDLGKTWYYPGYIIYSNPKFDYKLFIDKTAAEIYLPDKEIWINYDTKLMAVIQQEGMESTDS